MPQEHSKLTITYIDSNGEKSTVRVPGAPLDFGVTDFATHDALFDALVTSLDQIVSGEATGQARTYQAAVTGAAAPTDDAVQRERKWLVIGTTADTLKPVRMEIPCAKVGVVGLVTPSTPGANQYLDLSAGIGADIKAKLEAIWRAGDDFDKAVTVDRIELVNRNT